MDILTLIIVAGSLVIGLGIVYAILKLVRGKNVQVVREPVPVPIPQSEDITPPVETFTPIIKSPDRELYEKFILEYDNDSLKFDNVPYRPGAKMTCEFGISAGYKYFVKGTNRLWDSSMPIEKREMRWGYVRPHMGVDRAGAPAYTLKNGGIVQDPVIVPFNFNRTGIIDYGDYGYGSLILLHNDEYQFSMFIAHMDPKKDFLEWSLNRLKNGQSMDQGWVLGSAGTYGYSSGDHTHTEFKSHDETCEVFDILLEEKFGEKANKEYTTANIVKEYRKQHHYKDATERVIVEDWEAWKRKKKIIFANPYKFTRVDPLNGQVRSWYSSYLLFNGL